MLAAALAYTAWAQPKGADIHASEPNTMPEMRVRVAHGRYELRNATLVDLIRTAWSVGADSVVGGPDWLDTKRFDVIAPAPAGSTPEALHEMLRALLKERFQLVAVSDRRDSPVYAMSAGRRVELERGEDSGESGCRLQAPAKTVTLVCRGMTMAGFAKALPGVRETSGYLFNYPVVDRTGLAGVWNFSLTWTPRVAMRPSPPEGEVTTLFDAVEKQLGLKLNPIKVPHPVIVVAKVSEKPTPNAPGIMEQARPAPEFEVASIRPDREHPGGSSVRIDPGGRIRINMSLQGLISEAWGALNPTRIVDAAANRAKPLDATQWDVVAKAPHDEDSAAGWNGPVWNGVDIDSMRMMLRALLVERFGLAAHEEERVVPGYALAAGKPKLRKAEAGNRAGCREGPGADGKDPRLANPLRSRLVTCRSMTLGQFARELEDLMYGRAPVRDSTGIGGRYDMTISFSPPTAFASVGGPRAEGEMAASEPNGAISLFEAVNQQLGLKVRPVKVTAPVLVIDHVDDAPTEN